MLVGCGHNINVQGFGFACPYGAMGYGTFSCTKDNVTVKSTEKTTADGIETINEFKDLYSSSNISQTFRNAPSLGEVNALIIPVNFLDSDTSKNSEQLEIIKSGFFGDEIYSVYDGVVSETGNDIQDGNYIIIKIDDKTTVKYYHLEEINVEEGQSVEKGEVIAKMGNTGQSTGPNLAFAVYEDGVAVSPLAVDKSVEPQ